MTMRLWQTAQAAGVLATLAILVGLLVRPAPTLVVLWSLLIPLVPASLLLSPTIWRNVCPLATLNLLGNRSAGGRKLSARVLPGAGAVGIVLLAVMVPARRFVFNTDGPVLAATITVIALAALALGTVFGLKAGFCNSVCPVLPVERLYGQRPLLRVGNARCSPCTVCTAHGCIDLAPARSIPSTLGESGGSHAWLGTAFGIFAAAFPGFVVGYFTTVNGPIGSALDVYVRVGTWAMASYAVVFAMVRVGGMSSAVTMAALAAAAAGLYYWYAAEAITRELAMADASTVVIRIAALTLIGVWTWKAIAAPRGSRRLQA